MSERTHEHDVRDGHGLCCHCHRVGAYPSGDGWVVCSMHRGL